ncbi:MAG: tRNA (guanine37-N1)-methyltransferase [Saprospiraceae bacterium]|jgi:tRNA (guanine37-N1)-methyltransferase
MMNIDIVSIMPQMFEALNYGMIKRAIDHQALNIELWNPRDFTQDVHRTVDDRPYGGGPGMVMMAPPLSATLDAIKEQQRQQGNVAPVVFLTPQGKRLEQADVKEFARLPALTLLAGRYEGVDERLVRSRVDIEVSIGDYVLAGGEFPAMVLIDAVSRLLPDVLGNAESIVTESFEEDGLDYPQYTRPNVFNGEAVPDVLLSGNHQKIASWRKQQAADRTKQRRPDLLDAST